MKTEEAITKIFGQIKLLGYEQDIPEGQLRNIIMRTTGCRDPRTATNWINALQVFEKLEWKSPHIYTIKNNADKTGETK